VSNTSTLIRGYDELKAIVEHFRSHFYSRYLQQLRGHHTRLHPAPKGAVSFMPKCGHVVLVKVSDVSRAKWPLGVIESINKSKTTASVRIINWTKTNQVKISPLDGETYPTKAVTKLVSHLFPVELAPGDADLELAPLLTSKRPNLDQEPLLPAPSTSA